MKLFNVKLEGTTPLMHHRMRDEDLIALLGSKSGKKKPKEEQTPREIAESYSYKDKEGQFYIPMDYVVKAFTHVASDYKQKNSSRKSIKAVAAGVFKPTNSTALIIDKKGKPIKSFEVDLKKATNHLKGAVAVCRPRFDRWNVEFQVRIDDSILETETALEILEDSGRRSGIGSYRVNKSGTYGQFSVVEWKQVKSTKLVQ